TTAAVIRVFTCPDTTYRVKAGTEPPVGSAFGVEVGQATAVHGAHDHLFQDVRLWFKYTAGAVGTAPVIDGPLPTTIECVETGEQFQFELRANTIERPTVAVAMVLDQSGSMGWDAGTSGLTRLAVLKDAAKLFVTVIPDGNALGIVRFDQNAYPPNDPTFPGMPITRIVSAAERATARAVIDAHGAHGDTSVGDGLIMGHSQLLTVAPGDYSNTAMLLFTDGIENQPESIANAIAAGATDSRVHVIGLGNEFQVNTAALNTLSRNNLLLSGLLTPSTDDFFRVKKLFLQILAAVTNTSIVRDPIGFINTGTRIKIPFQLSETDISCRAILLTDYPVVELSVEAPDGTVIDAASGAAAGVTFERDGDTQTASFVAPLTLIGQADATGEWNVILEVDEKRYKRLLSILRDKDPRAADALAGRGARFCASVHTFSNLRMVAEISQDGYEPGSNLTLRARLTEYGVPVDGRAHVSALLEYPDGTPTTLPLNEVGPGLFECTLPATMPGLYRFTITAAGVTFRGAPFTREQLLTAAVFRKIDPPTDPGKGSTGDLCTLISCFLDENVTKPEFRKRLKEWGIDTDSFQKCIDRHCRD
ncbi:MAG: VWA domain-containing protein, partial [Specibacter sp.]